MRTDFVEYLKDKQLLLPSVIDKIKQIDTQCYAKMIENLSSYQIDTITNLSRKTKIKIICILEDHLQAERKKAVIDSSQYNTNHHIALLQALRELKTKKTQPEAGCVIS